MKKLLLLFIILICCISCSKEEDEAKKEIKEPVMQWTITTQSTCLEEDNTVYKTHCVTETTKNTISRKWVDSGIPSPTNCNKFSFTDIDGVEVEGYIHSTSSGHDICEYYID